MNTLFHIKWYNCNKKAKVVFKLQLKENSWITNKGCLTNQANSDKNKKGQIY